jgi:hypothetical protein
MDILRDLGRAVSDKEAKSPFRTSKLPRAELDLLVQSERSGATITQLVSSCAPGGCLSSHRLTWDRSGATDSIPETLSSSVLLTRTE